MTTNLDLKPEEESVLAAQAQALSLTPAPSSLVVATENVSHLSRYYAAA